MSDFEGSHSAFARITVKVELPKDIHFGREDFNILINSAITTLLGQAGPSYKVSHFDNDSLKGSVICHRSQINRVWAALSYTGVYVNKPIAIHLHSLTETTETC